MKITNLLPPLALFTPSTAVHLIKVISADEFIHRKITQPEDNFPLFRLPESQLRHIKFWFNRLSDPIKYPQVLGPCRPPGPLDHPHSSLNTAQEIGYLLFPLDDATRNEILGRPDPETVKRNIEIATGGRFETVEEVVGLVNAALGKLDVSKNQGGGNNDLGSLIPRGDDVLTLLASNFREPIAGLVVSVGCGPALYETQGGLWPEDMLVPMDEQRALVAGALYVIGDRGYTARRDRELRRAIKKAGLGIEQRWYGDTGPLDGDDDDDGDLRQEEIQRLNAVQKQQKRSVEETCRRRTESGAMSFGERLEALDKDILTDEEEWVMRYEMIVAALRASLYAMVPTKAWTELESSVDEVVSAAEELAGKLVEQHLQNLVQNGKQNRQSQEFERFLVEEAERIREWYRPFKLTEAVVKRIGYWRWRREAR